MGIALVAIILALFGVLFVISLQDYHTKSPPKEAPRVEGQFAPIGKSAALAVIAADDEAKKKTSPPTKDGSSSTSSGGEGSATKMGREPATKSTEAR